MPSENNILDLEVVIPLNYLSNSWKLLNLPLINCKIEFNLKWAKYCLIPKISRTLTAVDPNVNQVVHELATATSSATFQINNAKLNVPVVSLSFNDNIKFLENIQEGFKRTISWNKYRSEITTEPRNNNLDNLIDPTFKNIDGLFVPKFKNGANDPIRNYFYDYYMPLVEVKEFNVFIDNKPFFDQPVKNKQKAYEKLIKMSKNDDYTTGNLLDYLYHQNYYNLIGIDLSKQANTSIPQEINFVGSVEVVQ